VINFEPACSCLRRSGRPRPWRSQSQSQVYLLQDRSGGVSLTEGDSAQLEIAGRNRARLLGVRCQRRPAVRRSNSSSEERAWRRTASWCRIRECVRSGDRGLRLQGDGETHVSEGGPCLSGWRSPAGPPLRRPKPTSACAGTAPEDRPPTTRAVPGSCACRVRSDCPATGQTRGARLLCT